MGVQISIRGVPEDVRDELAARARLQGKSMQEYLLGELERLAAKPSVEQWLKDLKRRKALTGTRVPSSEIVRAVHADRK